MLKRINKMLNKIISSTLIGLCLLATGCSNNNPATPTNTTSSENIVRAPRDLNALVPVEDSEDYSNNSLSTNQIKTAQTKPANPAVQSTAKPTTTNTQTAAKPTTTNNTSSQQNSSNSSEDDNSNNSSSDENPVREFIGNIGSELRDGLTGDNNSSESDSSSDDSENNNDKKIISLPGISKLL
jgi:hypothetical protein